MVERKNPDEDQDVWAEHQNRGRDWHKPNTAVKF